MSSYNESKHFESITQAGTHLDEVLWQAWAHEHSTLHAVRSAKSQGIMVSEGLVDAMFSLFDDEYAGVAS